ncbi:MAG: hypothetical protein LBN36_09500 [Clostridiales Family XIII bacterium]|jgi:hypothetical protein|nr:hypothetical protein [Clostridiales Family XIII bacterium]
MIAALTKKTTDYSDQKHFAFGFDCDRCEREWTSSDIPFEQSEFSTVVHEETKSLLWSEAHRVAFERANLEAQFHFNYCARFEQWVCDDCFQFCEGADEDVCFNCYARAGRDLKKGIRGYNP